MYYLLLIYGLGEVHACNLAAMASDGRNFDMHEWIEDKHWSVNTNIYLYAYMHMHALLQYTHMETRIVPTVHKVAQHCRTEALLHSW